jgi:hypothetical protein
MAIPQLSQDAIDLELKWYKGDPVSLSWKVLDVDWSGTYTAGVYKDATAATLLQAITISATYSAVTGDTTFTATISDADSDNVGAGLWYWKCRQTAGLTRFAGAVRVDA